MSWPMSIGGANETAATTVFVVWLFLFSLTKAFSHIRHHRVRELARGNRDRRDRFPPVFDDEIRESKLTIQFALARRPRDVSAAPRVCR
jgi:hypothetical protein